jgi:hypothetical protein
MRQFGAKDFQVVAGAETKTAYKIPSNLIKVDPNIPFHIPKVAELGSDVFSMDKLRTSNSTITREIRDPSELRAAVARAAKQTPRSGVNVEPNEPLKQLKRVAIDSTADAPPAVDPKIAPYVQDRQSAKFSEMFGGSGLPK